MKACFNMFEGKKFLKEYVLNKRRVIVGSVPGADLEVPLSDEIPCYFEVVFRDGRFFAFSPSGDSRCVLNSEVMPTTQTVLRIGDKIRVGDDFVLIFDIAKEREQALSSAVPATKVSSVSQPEEEVDEDGLRRTVPVDSMPSYAVEVRQGNLVLERLRLVDDHTYIGRMAENHIALDDPLVSRSHAVIERREDGYFIVDQQSENGVFLNGIKVEQAPLKPGDVVKIGEHELRFIIAEPEDVTEDATPMRKEEDSDVWMSKTLNLSPEEQAEILKAIEGSSSAPAGTVEEDRDLYEGETELVRSEEGNGLKEEKGEGSATLVFSVGGRSFERSIEFDEILSSDSEEEFVEIRLNIGGRLFVKKINI